MKKTKLLTLLMAIVMMAMSPTKVWADDNVDVLIGGADDAAIAANPSDCITPFRNDSKYVTTVTLYTHDQIGVSGKINSIAYYVKSNSELTSQKVTIYMKMVNVTTTELPQNYEIRTGDWKEVYSGNGNKITLGSSTGWETFTFDTPFSYTDTKNLVVAVTVNRNSGTMSGDLKYAYSTRTNCATMSRASGSVPAYASKEGYDNLEQYTVNGEYPQACMKMNITPCSHSFPEVSEKPATCVEASMSTCTKCGLELYDGKTPATGHDYHSDTYKCSKCKTYDPTYVIYNGTDGTCEWVIYNNKDTRYADGEMVVRPMSGTEGTLDNWTSTNKPNWSIATAVNNMKKVRFEGNITAPNLYYMFRSCKYLSEVDFTNLTTTNATSTSNMFAYCRNLTTIKWANVNTENVTDMSYMFHNSNLTTLDLSNVNTAKVENMSFMFYNCSELTTLNLSNFNTASVTTMEGMFAGCSKLNTLTLGNNFTAAKVTTMKNMFSGCSEFTSLDLSNINTASVTDMNSMFVGCSKLNSLTLGNNFTAANVKDMSYMFNSCKAFTSLDLSKFNTAEVTTMQGMFYNCSGLTSLNLNFNTAKVTNMSAMFYDCSKLNTLTLGNNFTAANVTTMSSMFSGCTKLETLNLSNNFNTAKVTDMSYMFKGCSEFTTLDLSKFNTASVTTMEEMFSGCTKLGTLTFGNNFSTDNVTTIVGMFKDCSALTSLDLSSFNTANVTTMNYTFNNCSALTSLVLGNFSTANVRYTNDMLTGCTKLNTLTIKALPYLREDYKNVLTDAGTTVTYDLQLNDNSIVYSRENHLPAATAWTAAPTYTREMSNEWGTIVVPFAITYSQSNGNYKLYQLSATSASTLTFTEYDNNTEIAAGTPMVIKAVGTKTADKYTVTLTANGNAVNTAITDNAAVGGLTMKGTYDKKENQTKKYFIAQGKFWYADAAITINPFRAWFEGTLPSSAKEFNIVVDDEATGISNVQFDNLQFTNGKFLENGRIVIVKNGKKYSTSGQVLR